MKQQAILSLLFLVLFQSSIRANEDYYKEFRKSIAVPANVTLDLQVQFADVVITTWNQPTMEIVVTMDLNVKSQERADNIFNALSVIENSDWIRLSIDIPCEKTWGISKSESTNISAMIKMPISGNLSGHLGFGDLSLTDIQGVCKLNTSYGDIVANSMTNASNTLKHDFGDLVIKKLGGGTVSASYGDVRVDELEGNAEFKNDFGDLKIQSINKSCGRLVVMGSYGNIVLGTAKNNGANFDLRSGYGSIKVDSAAKKSSSKSDFNSESVQGVLGEGECKIVVTNNFGDIKLTYAN